ncbi:TonB family protein [Candidatus Magnetominusculus dajiuhuensis]|uniref:cell envelope integrity protein TolA n=1 Tax=Candidatus Magnetominusculus dajiuhuensis TaxID=3137712 RepID=UPI003B42BA00
MRQPSVQFSTVASLLLHTVVFGAFMYTLKHQPRYVLPKTYTVKLVAPVKAATVQPSLGEPRAQQRPTEKELPPVKEEPAKAAKYEMKETPKQVPIPRKETPRPTEVNKPVKEIPKPVIETKKPAETIAMKPEITKKVAQPVAVKPEITKKPPPKEQPKEQSKEQPKDQPKDSAKDSSSVEDRISMLKSKKRLEQHAMLRSMVDLSKKDVKMGQSPTGATQSTSPSFGDAVNNEYSDIVGAHVRKRWAYPESAKKSLEAVVVFTIKQDGRIEGMKLEKSSGNSFFDRSALSAVNKSVPMPQPPLDAYEVGIRFTQ